MKKEPLSNTLIFKPRYNEIDAMKVVHHSKYWIWFEECRFDFFRRILGFSTESLKNPEYYTPVIDCQCQYKKPVYFGNEIAIDTRLLLTKASSLIFQYEISTNHYKKEVLTKATTKHAIIDLDFKLKLIIPEKYKEKIDEAFSTKSYAFLD